LDPIVGEFIKYIYSKEGQQVVVKDGFFPLKADATQKELKKLD
jgi:phosphate transport system substrate-binding protein